MSDAITLSGAQDGLAKVWRTEGLEGLRDLPNAGFVTTVAISPNGMRYATGGYDGIRVWDAKTFELIQHLPTPVVDVSWGEGVLVAVPRGSSEVRILDDQSFRSIGVLTGHLDDVLSVAISADGKTVVTGSKDRTARVWRLSPVESRAVLLGHRSSVLAVALGPDGLIATGGADKTVRLWDMKTGEAIRHLAGHRDWVLDVEFLTNPPLVVSSSRAGTVRIWDPTSGVSLHQWDLREGPVAALATQDGVIVAASAVLETLDVNNLNMNPAPLDLDREPLEERCRWLTRCGEAVFESNPELGLEIVRQAQRLRRSKACAEYLLTVPELPSVVACEPQ